MIVSQGGMKMGKQVVRCLVEQPPIIARTATGAVQPFRHVATAPAITIPAPVIWCCGNVQRKRGTCAENPELLNHHESDGMLMP